MKNELTARRLIEALDRRGLKAQDLADLTGVSKSSISQYVNGTHCPSNISAGKMADVLGVSPVWLMGFDVPMTDDYYDSAEAASVAQQTFDDPDLRALFDAARNSKPEDIQMAADLLRRLKLTNPDG